MTLWRSVRVVLAAGTLLGMALIVRLWAAPVIPVPAFLVLPTTTPRAARAGRANVDSLSRAIAVRNPFRLDRRVAEAPFDPLRAEGAPPAPPRPTRPNLVLTGVMLGGQPAALIEGLPGGEGSRLVNVGERYGDYLLREVTVDHAVVVSRDTTWVLRVNGRAP